MLEYLILSSRKLQMKPKGWKMMMRHHKWILVMNTVMRMMMGKAIRRKSRFARYDPKLNVPIF